ncbi:hypothetical protein [Rhodopirellula europaea]
MLACLVLFGVAATVTMSRHNDLAGQVPPEGPPGGPPPDPDPDPEEEEEPEEVPEPGGTDIPPAPVSPGPLTPLISPASAEDAVEFDPPQHSQSTQLEIYTPQPQPEIPGSPTSGCSSCGGPATTPEPEEVPEEAVQIAPQPPACGMMPTPVPMVDSASRIDKFTYNYMHWGWDVLPATPASSARVQRIHRSRDLDRSGSFGPGCFTNFDIRLTLADEHLSGSDWDAMIFDPNLFYPIRFDAEFTLGGSGTDVVFVRDADYPQRVDSLEVLDSLMQPITGESSDGSEFHFTDAKYARMTNWAGGEFLFELVLAGPTPVGYNASVDHPPHGRLIEVETPKGGGYTITYKSWTPAEITASPERQWQIDTITDARGQTISVDYNPTQQSGDWVISKVTQPSTDEVDYTYAGGFLSEVDYPDGSQTTITYSAGVNGTVEMDIFDAAADPQHRRKTVVLTGSVATVGGTVVPTATGLTRMATNGTGELLFLSGSTSGDTASSPGEGFLYVGGGRLMSDVSTGTVQPSKYFDLGWEEDTNATTGAPEFTGDFEPQTTSYTGWQTSGQTVPTSATSDTGVSFEFQYDSENRIQYAIHSDDTFKAYTYGSHSKPIRSRDRLGRVTKMTYDAEGRMLTEAVGLTDGPSNSSGVTPLTYDLTPTDDVQTSGSSAESVGENVLSPRLNGDRLSTSARAQQNGAAPPASPSHRPGAGQCQADAKARRKGLQQSRHKKDASCRTLSY